MVAPLKPSSPVMARGWLPATFLKDNYQAVNSLLTPSESKVNVGKFFFPTACTRCWLCEGPDSEWVNKLSPDSAFPAGPRFGAYLRVIPPKNRVGDYVHCTGRIVNIIFKRLLVAFPEQRISGPYLYLETHCSHLLTVTRLKGFFLI